MNINEIPEIQLQPLACSACSLEPKEAFFDWLRGVHGGDVNINHIYEPSEDAVWLLPPITRFDAQRTMDEFFRKIKPLLLRQYLGGFVFNEGQMPSIDCKTFDLLFELRIRHNVKDIRDIAGVSFEFVTT